MIREKIAGIQHRAFFTCSSTFQSALEDGESADIWTIILGTRRSYVPSTMSATWATLSWSVE